MLRRVICGTPSGYYTTFFGLLGGIVLRALCLRLVDFKVIIAYSSVAHIALVLAGVIAITQLGETGSLGMSLSHGVVSSALFFGAGMYYNSSNRRLFLFNKNAINLAP